MCVRVLFFFFFSEGFLLQIEGNLVKPVNFPQDSGCLTCDEFLVIFKGDHTLREGQTITTSSLFILRLFVTIMFPNVDKQRD